MPSDESESEESVSKSSPEASAGSVENETAPKLFTQRSLNDFVRNMNLSKLMAVQCGQ